MNQKSITFRCSEKQHERLLSALNDTPHTRTQFITTALECFLAYAEQEPIRRQNLFELVQGIDSLGGGPSFEEQT